MINIYLINTIIKRDCYYERMRLMNSDKNNQELEIQDNMKKNNKCVKFTLGIIASFLIAVEIISGCVILRINYFIGNIENDKYNYIFAGVFLIFYIIVSIVIYSYMQLVATWDE